MLTIIGVIILLAIAKADTPAYCFGDQYLGKWKIQTSKYNYKPVNDAITCPDSFDIDSTVTVTLLSPNVVISESGSTGTWTQYASQGLEITIDGFRYHWYAHWESDTLSSNTLSYCGMSHPGMSWTRPTGITPAKWGCLTAENIDPVYPTNNNGTQAEPGPVNPDANSGTREVLRRYPTFTTKHYDHPRPVMPDRAAPVGMSRDSTRARIPTPGNDAPFSGDDLPVNFDWSDVNGRSYVPPIRDQGGCGSCYLHAATGAMMARTMIASNLSDPLGQTTFLSRSHVNDCDHFGGQQCGGGFAVQNGIFAETMGILTDDSYGPYIDEDCDCHADTVPASAPRYYYTAYQYLGGYFGAESRAEELQWEIYRNGPLAISVYVTDEWRNYESGVFVQPVDDNGADDVPRHYFAPKTNHAVMMTGWGFDEESGLPYWRIANSWGEDWGESGTIRQIRGQDDLSIESCPVAYQWWPAGPVDSGAPAVSVTWAWVAIISLVLLAANIVVDVIVYRRYHGKVYRSLDETSV